MTALRPAAHAFDIVAPEFDTRFGSWRSVAAQRRSVHSVLLQEIPANGRVLEIGGGTGEDACFLAQHGYQVLLTDPSPTMVNLAREKLMPLGSSAEIVAGEELDAFADLYLGSGRPQFDGAFSNFAPLNCVLDLRPVASGLSRLLRPGAAAILVLFGTICPAEVLVEVLRRRPSQALRRLKRGPVSARLARQDFEVVYHTRADVQRAFAPWFTLERRLGIGVAVPPSAAEPWISTHPGFLAALEKIDEAIAGSLAMLGDHVLYVLRRNPR